MQNKWSKTLKLYIVSFKKLYLGVVKAIKKEISGSRGLWYWYSAEMATVECLGTSGGDGVFRNLITAVTYPTRKFIEPMPSSKLIELCQK